MTHTHIKRQSDNANLLCIFRRHSSLPSTVMFNFRRLIPFRNVFSKYTLLSIVPRSLPFQFEFFYVSSCCIVYRNEKIFFLKHMTLLSFLYFVLTTFFLFTLLQQDKIMINFFPFVLNYNCHIHKLIFFINRLTTLHTKVHGSTLRSTTLNMLKTKISTNAMNFAQSVLTFGKSNLALSLITSLSLMTLNWRRNEWRQSRRPLRVKRK